MFGAQDTFECVLLLQAWNFPRVSDYPVANAALLKLSQLLSVFLFNQSPSPISQLAWEMGRNGKK